MRNFRSGPMLLLSLILTTLMITPVFAGGRGDDAGRKSKNGKTEGVIDGVSITLEYGRPQVKKRTLWVDLAPYGKVWRTGADEATTVSFSADVAIEGKNLPAGTYALFTIPGEESWTLIFNKTAEQWGAYGHDPAQDALRVSVKPSTHEHVEAMDFVADGHEVVLRWGTTAVPFAVSKAK